MRNRSEAGPSSLATLESKLDLRRLGKGRSSGRPGDRSNLSCEITCEGVADVGGSAATWAGSMAADGAQPPIQLTTKVFKGTESTLATSFC